MPAVSTRASKSKRTQSNGMFHDEWGVREEEVGHTS